MHIRRITISDVGQLQKIALQTFSDTFSAVNSKDNMEKYITERFSIESLKTELNNKNSEFYFAEVDNKIVGKAIRAAGERNAGYIWLGVWEKNTRALAFYQLEAG